MPTLPTTNPPSPMSVPEPTKKPWSALLHWLIFVVIVVVVVGGAWYFKADLGIDTLINKLQNSNPQTNTNTSYTPGTIPATVAASLSAQGTLQKFSSLSDVQAFLDSHSSSTSSYATGEISSDMRLSAPTATTLPAVGQATDDTKNAASSTYSTTNIQVAGVDEADIVKTDGNMIYAVSRQNVFLIDATPAKDAKILSTIALDSTPEDMYITKNRLIIYGTDSGTVIKPLVDSIRPYSQYAFLKIFDVSDPVNPRQLKSMGFEGSVLTTRMIGDVVYMVTSQSTYGIGDTYPIPLMLEDNQVLPETKIGSSPCNCADVWYVDSPYGNYTFTTVSAINVADVSKDVASSVYLMTAGQNVYVSQNNMYIVYTKYVSEQTLSVEVMKDMLLPKLSAKDRQVISDIEQVPSDVLRQDEKLQKMAVVFQRYVSRLSKKDQESMEKDIEAALKKKYQDISKELEKSVIHKIALSGTTMQNKGSGEVTGHVLNQFSMDESGDYFRIATTKSQTWSQFQFSDTTTSYNNLYVLDGNLKVVGKVENLAEGEQIYSVRFMQNRAYIVTFRQTDPLFAIDLANPKDPKVLGKLKVPGYSSYLHPYNDTLLIGLGKDADENGRVKGVKLSLYNVSDVSSLKEVDTYEIGDAGSDSIALTEHKAFLFDKEKQLLVIPITMREVLTNSQIGSVATNGALVFKITEKGFEYRGTIKHSDGSTDDNASNYYYGISYYGTSVKRSLFIDNTLYTLSDKFLKANSLADLSDTASVKLAPGSTSNDYTIIR